MFCHLRTTVLAACLGLGATAPALAQSLDQAIALWLDGDDETSLQMMADLADAGNTDAQLLLGQIDRDIVEGGASDYVVNLPVDARDDLLRNGEGNDSVSWLKTLSDPALAEHGEALFDYRVNLNSAVAADRLAQVGEMEAAQYMVWLTMERGRFDRLNELRATNSAALDVPLIAWMQGAVGSDGVVSLARLERDLSPMTVAGLLVLDRLRVVLKTDYRITDEVEALISALRGRPFEPGSVDLLRLRDDLIRLSEHDPRLGNLAALCASCEGEEIDPECIVESLKVIGDYRSLFRIRTPTEEVISEADFQSSARARDILQQLIVSRTDFYNPTLRSSCIRGWVGE